MGALRVIQRRGFSLSELLISILILATLSVLLVGVIPASVIGLKGAGQRAHAAILARQSLEDVRRDGFSRLPAPGTVVPLARQNANGTEYAREIRVEQAVDSHGVGLDVAQARLVIVVVRWKSRQGALEYQACLPLFKEL